jgi:methionyl-tRNA formyltransferase
MNIDILCTLPSHPVNAMLDGWVERNRSRHRIAIRRGSVECVGGDLLFLVSCHEIVRPSILGKYRHCATLHASDLPEGRGWSPHIWSILSGRQELTVSLLVAVEGLDTGDVWRKAKIELDGTELFDEINAKLFAAEEELMDWLVANADVAVPIPQSGTPTWHPRRRPEDSRLDPLRAIAEQFDLLRVCDPDRFPAFFEHRGCRYRLSISREEPSK